MTEGRLGRGGFGVRDSESRSRNASRASAKLAEVAVLLAEGSGGASGVVGTVAKHVSFVPGSRGAAVGPNWLVVSLHKIIGSEEGFSLTLSNVGAATEDIGDEGRFSRRDTGLLDAGTDEEAGSKRSEARSDSSRVLVKTVVVVALIVVSSGEAFDAVGTVLKLG